MHDCGVILAFKLPELHDLLSLLHVAAKLVAAKNNEHLLKPKNNIFNFVFRNCLFSVWTWWDSKCAICKLFYHYMNLTNCHLIATMILQHFGNNPCKSHHF
jgi:hypothetical protein